MTGASSLDAFVAPDVWAAVEEAYHARINRQSSLAEALKDPGFLDSPNTHVALFADHGAVHARDVAQQVLQVLDTVHGRLIPRREPVRLAWMKAYGVLLACLHDIGMVDSTPVGRAMHPEFATQVVLGAAFDGVMEGLRADDRGGFLERARILGADGLQPQQILREALAMANCHSKSKVPVAVLNDRSRLRRTMAVVATTDLAALYRLQRDARAGGSEVALPPGHAGDAFAWLEAASGPVRDFVDDVIDTLRALRCADALRQRGTVLKTSGNDEVFVDERTANAVYALRPDEEHVYLLEIPDAISAG